MPGLTAAPRHAVRALCPLVKGDKRFGAAKSRPNGFNNFGFRKRDRQRQGREAFGHL